jgi:hypothetical protein
MRLREELHKHLNRRGTNIKKAVFGVFFRGLCSLDPCISVFFVCLGKGSSKTQEEAIDQKTAISRKNDRPTSV